MTAFVLGNGVSRLAVDLDQLANLGPIYGCNALYRTYTPAVLVATDRPISHAIQASGYSRLNRFYTRHPESDTGARTLIDRYRGYSSGPNAVSIAAQDGHPQIYLIGFDMAPSDTGCFNNVYADTEFYKNSTATPTYTGNWTRQLRTVFADFSKTEFVRVVGKNSADIPEFQPVTNVQSLSMQQFLNRINTAPKDL
jgi:hypothetical protein